MRHLAIGDIHGCLTALNSLIEFCELRSDDLVILLGDYVDNGPHTAGVLDRLIALAADCQLVALRGNHDLVMLNARQDQQAFEAWLEKGGDLTLQSYGLPLRRERVDQIPPSHWDFLAGTLPYYELPGHFFVHANASAEIPLAEQTEQMLYWEKFDHPAPHQSGKVMACGHTSQRSGMPVNLGHAICIDTRVYDNGWLTCLDVDTGHLWQANQRGDTRRLHLDELP
jgi:serine/threonine protein phosphatase 1